MPITLNCPCGKSLRVPDEHAGKRVKCPACGGVAAVPKPEPAPMFEVVEDVSEALVSPPPPPRAKPVPARADEDDEDADRRGYGVSKRRDEDDEPPPRPRGRRAADEDDEDERPKKKPKFKKGRSRREDGDGGGGSSAAAEIGGGLLAMLIGAVLFVLALSNDRAPIYGSVLFICGLVGVVKGLNGGSGG